MTTFVLGPEGTFSHELALQIKAADIRLVPTIHRIFDAVGRGEGDGIVPIENSEAGGVGATLDGLIREQVFITAEIYMPIERAFKNLRAPPDARAVQRAAGTSRTSGCPYQQQRGKRGGGAQ